MRTHGYLTYSLTAMLLCLAACSEDKSTNPPSPGGIAANAGVDRWVDVGTSVMLDGSGSTGGSLSYNWTLIYQEGQSSAPTTHSGVSFSFTLDEPDSLQYELAVTSGASSDRDTVIVRSNPPTISGISPLLGPAGTPVTITGTNFSPTVGQNEVSFNGIAAPITTASFTELVAECPPAATTGEVSVMVLGTGDRVVGPTFTVGSSNWQIIQNVPSEVHWLEGVFFLDGDNGWVVGSNALGEGLIIRTGDGGATWSINQKTTGGLTAIHFSGSTYGTAVGRGNEIWHTDNGGAAWAEQTSIRDSGIFSGDLQDVFFWGPSDGWAVGSDLNLFGVIFGTADGGQNWGLVAGAPNPDIIALTLNGVSFADQLNGTAVGWRGTVSGASILRTNDGGQNWLAQYGDDPNDPVTFLFAVHMITRFDVWAVGGAGMVLHTTDGATWVDESASLPGAPLSGILMDVHFVDALNGVIVGDDGLIFRMVNGGPWTQEANPAGAVRLMDVHVVDVDNGWAVGNDVNQIGAPVILRRQ